MTKKMIGDKQLIERTYFFYESREDPSKHLTLLRYDGSEAEPVIEHNGVEYYQIEDFVYDFNSLSEYAKQNIAAAAWKAFQEFMRRPDAQEILDAEKERLKLEGSTLLDPRPRRTVKAK